MKEGKICSNCIWLCDLMFCNVCILLCDLFMSKVLKIWFLLLQSKYLFVFIIFDFCLEFEIDQVFQPLVTFCPLNVAWKDKWWMQIGSKWKCKVNTYIIAHFVKWLLTNNLRAMHSLMAKKVKSKKPSTSKGGAWHQNHAKMNIRILGNVMVM